MERSEVARRENAGVNPVIIQRGILKAAEVAADAITAQSKKVKGREDYKRVATISANGDEKIGDLMADAMERVGKEGVITVDEGKSTESVLEYTEGMQFDKGFLSPYFLTNPTTLEAVLEDCLILLHEKKISNLAELRHRQTDFASLRTVRVQSGERTAARRRDASGNLGAAR